MGKLKLRIEPEGDGTAELIVSFEVDGFAGCGSAWFGLSQIEAMANQLAKYPLDDSDLPCIEGGYWKKDLSKELEQEHLHISAYPVGLRAAIGIKIRVSTPYHSEAERRAKRFASVELLVTYAKLANFSEELRKMAKGSLTEVTLEEERI